MDLPLNVRSDKQLVNISDNLNLILTLTQSDSIQAKLLDMFCHHMRIIVDLFILHELKYTFYLTMTSQRCRNVVF